MFFFEKYSQMDRSKKGLDGAGEWHVLKQMLPDFRGKRILDLGCGFGWHCEYAIKTVRRALSASIFQKNAGRGARQKELGRDFIYLPAHRRHRLPAFIL